MPPHDDDDDDDDDDDLPRDPDALVAWLARLNRRMTPHGEGTLKVDYDSRIEALWGHLALVGVGALFKLTLFALLGGRKPPWWAFVASGAAVVLGLTLRRLSDDYLLFDFVRREVRFHRSQLGRRTEWRLAWFSDLAGVTVGGKKSGNKHSSWWDYTIYLVLDSGRTIPISDPVRDALRQQNVEAAHFARALRTHLWPGQTERCMRVRRDRKDGRVHVTQVGWVHHVVPLLVAILLAAAVVIGIPAYFITR